MDKVFESIFSIFHAQPGHFSVWRALAALAARFNTFCRSVFRGEVVAYFFSEIRVMASNNTQFCEGIQP